MLFANLEVSVFFVFFLNLFTFQKQGIAASDFTACFQKNDIETLFTNPRVLPTCMPDCLYITIDPNGGGASKLGVASGYFNGVDLVVSIFFLFFIFLVCVVFDNLFQKNIVLHNLSGIPCVTIFEKPSQQDIYIVSVWSWHINICRIQHFIHLCSNDRDEFLKTGKFGAAVVGIMCS